jgi:hypothetical protein
MSIHLNEFLENKSTNSPFKSCLSNRGGYITFSNSGQRGSVKYFTIGLDSFITTLKDILKHNDNFIGHENYVESEWRDLGSQFYSDDTVNAMATVQTKPLFSTISKLIVWANEPLLDNINTDQNVELSREYLEKAISKLEILADTFKPNHNSKVKSNNVILSNKILRQIIFESFKYIINRFGENIVLHGNELKDTTIENRNYVGLSLNNYFGFETLIGIFETEQTLDLLKSSGTPRFIEEKINVLGNENSYFTSQWNGVDNGRGLSLENFNRLLADVSQGLLKIVKLDGVYKLIEKTLSNDVSPLIKTSNTIYYGSPGTGKSHKVDQIIKELDTKFYERVTFHPEYDNSSFVGGYKPVSDVDSEGNGVIKYKFVPQVFTNIYLRAWQDLDNQYYLVIEEINRGNCAEIFGEIFQLLDRNTNYTVTPSKELNEYLINEALEDENHLGIINGLKLPPNLSILATMNTSDQSLFPMDSAFKRRWDWEYIPIDYSPKDNDSFEFEIDIEDGKKYSWIKFIETINKYHIKNNPSLGMDKCIGNYFIKPDKGNIITLKPFINKVIFYLWNDVFKDEDNKVFEENTSYEDFFPVETNGKTKIKELFIRIGLEPKNTLTIVEDENQLGQVAEDKEETEF